MRIDPSLLFLVFAPSRSNLTRPSVGFFFLARTRPDKLTTSCCGVLFTPEALPKPTPSRDLLTCVKRRRAKCASYRTPYQKQGLASNNFTLPAAIRTRVHVTLPGMIAESRDMLPALEPLVPSTSPFSSSSAPRVTRPFRSR